VMSCPRREYYLKNKEPRAGTPEHITGWRRWSARMVAAEVILGKQRHGPTARSNCNFEAELTPLRQSGQGNALPDAIRARAFKAALCPMPFDAAARANRRRKQTKRRASRIGFFRLRRQA